MATTACVTGRLKVEDFMLSWDKFHFVALVAFMPLFAAISESLSLRPSWPTVILTGQEITLLDTRDMPIIRVIQGRTNLAANNFELLELGHVLLGGLVEIFAIITTVSLIGNMAPPKRDS